MEPPVFTKSNLTVTETAMEYTDKEARTPPLGGGQCCGPMKRGRSFNDRQSRTKNQANRSNCKNVGIVIGDFTGLFQDELVLKLGDRIEILSMDTQVSRNIGWWTGKDEKGKIGIFPSNCVKVISLSSSRSLNEQAEVAQHDFPLELSFDDITLFEVVGIGGFGKVYRGEYRGEEVAVKVARNTTFDSLKAIKEVLSEAEKFAHLAHQNVCALVGVCLVKDVSLVMEYARGGALSTVLHERKISLPVDVLLDWATQISEGMCYLHHEANPTMIHRDLKSSNILLTYQVFPDNLHSNVIKLTDFGLAKEIEHTTHMSGAGTYPWMAPEVIKSQDFSKKSDVWSFGVVLWELLTGEKPYTGLNMFVIAYGVGHGTLSLPIPEGCPDFLRGLLNACWKRPHSNRPSFEEICSVLQHRSASKSEFLSKGVEEINSMRNSWKEDIKKELDAFKKLEMDLHSREDALTEKMKQQERKMQEKMATLEKIEEQLKKELEEVNKKKGKEKEGRPPRIKPFSLKKLVRFFSKPETKKETATHSHSKGNTKMTSLAKPRKQLSEGAAVDYADQAVTPTVVMEIAQMQKAGPHNNKLHKESPTTADSIQHPMLQYDSGINTDASGHSSISPKDLHNASSSDIFDCNSTSVTNIREPTASSNTGRPYLMSFNPPSPKTRKANSAFNPLTTEFDPLHDLPRASGSPMQNGSQADPIRTVASTPKLLQSPSLVKGKTRSEHRVSSSGLPNLELQTESPSIARPRPRPRGSSQVDTILFRSPDGPFVPRSPTFVTRSPTGSIQSLTTYPTFEDTSIPCPSDDGSSVSSFGLANQSASDMEGDYHPEVEGDYHPDLYPVGTFRWSLGAGIPM